MNESDFYVQLAQCVSAMLFLIPILPLQLNGSVELANICFILAIVCYIGIPVVYIIYKRIKKKV